MADAAVTEAPTSAGSDIAAPGDTAAKSRKSGYTYWKRDIDDGHVLKDNTPQKLKEEEAAAAQQQVPERRLQNAGSSWNVAGTWEEKDTSVIAREELERILSSGDFVLLDGEGTRICVTKASITGDSYAYNIRGRPRLGFELKVKISWEGTFEGQEVSGDLDISELDSSDLDGMDIREKKPSGKAAPSEASKKASAALKKGAMPAMKRACEELRKNILER